MPKHAKTSRTARRVAAITATAAAGLALTAGTATADDERCEDPHGVTVCAPADVEVGDVDLDVLTHDEDEGWGFPPVHLGP